MTQQKHTVYYCVNDADDMRFKLESTFDLSDGSWVAEEAAEDYHTHHDGWEDGWPLTFIMFETEDGPEVCRFEVEREEVPVFHAVLSRKAL